MSEQTKKAIFKLCQDRVDHLGPFEIFATKLMELGATRHSFDLITNEILYYSKDQLLCAFKLSDMVDPKTLIDNKIGQTNLNAVKQTIADFDAGTIQSAIQFHQQLGLAGIVYISVHFVERKIYYLSFDGQHYLEQY